MKPTRAYAAKNATTPLAPFSFERRDAKPHDVAINIEFCGVCHSDIHQARNEWGGGATYPMVPGHEIVGRVAAVGSKVSKFKVGDSVGVGCFVDSCRDCPSCREGLEQYCDKGMVGTYNSTERDGSKTQGGYSDHIVVDENYVLRMPSSLDLKAAAPLLCAGITTYSPLMHWGVGPGHKVAVVGLGGLGHMAVKIANAMGAEVTVLSTSRAKEADAKRLGAKHFIATGEADGLAEAAGTFDFIVDAVSAAHDYNAYLNTLKRDGTMILLGVPEEPTAVHPFSLIMKRRKLGGSLIGGIRETQEMLDFCAEHNIVSDVEMIPIQKINEAYTRMIKGDVRYRFVIDMTSLKTEKA